MSGEIKAAQNICTSRLWSGREREREQEEGKKCRAQDPVGSHLDHSAYTLINNAQTQTHTETLPHFSVDLIPIFSFPLIWLLSALWLHYICSASNTVALVSFVKELIQASTPHPSLTWPGPPLSPLSETVKDRDRELIQQHVWCIFKQLWTFSSFQPTEDLICYNLISG